MHWRFTDKALLHCLDGGEDLLQLANDQPPQGLEPLDSLPYKHQDVQGRKLILVTQELNQLRIKQFIL